MDKLKELKQNIRDYSNFKKEKKAYEKDMEQRQFEDYKERLYLPEVEAQKGGFIAKGCGKVMNDRRKVTKMY